MKHGSMLALVLLSWLIPKLAAAAFVELDVPEERSWWVGQRVSFAVEVGVEGRFSGSTVFDLPRLDGVVLMKPEERAILSSVQRDGREYSVQRHEFSVFSQRSGPVVIPEFRVRCGGIREFGQEAEEFALMAPSFELEFVLPEGVRPGRAVVSTSRLELEENWTPRPGTEPVKAGAAFERSVTIRAEDVPGMLLPRVLPEEVPGVSVYTDSARVEDRLQRGEFTGEREERVTYVCSQAGRVQIPAVRIRWWDPETEEWKERELPGVQLEVAGVADSVVAPVMESKADAGMESGGWLRGLLWGFLALLVAGGVGMWWYVRRAYELPPLNP
jgi:hypothetical protein